MRQEPRIQVLLVDRAATDRDALAVMLEEIPGPGYDVAWAAPTLAAGESLPGRAVDIVLLNLSAMSADPPEVLAGLNRAFQGLPVIALTEVDDEDTGLVAMRGGAQDCLVKGEFDGRWLSRIIRYAIERHRTETALRQSEEFFRLISENVTDLIAVIDRDGRRLYHSRSYRTTLGESGQLDGTDSFAELHPEDRETIQRLFRETLATGIGRRAEYRMRLADGTVRQIESQGNVIRDEHGVPSKVVVVSRDITERREAMETLGRTLVELQRAHRELQAAQLQLVQSEKLEAVSTFAAGIAHEVKNPLQTILLGLDFLRVDLEAPSPNTTLVLREMETAARRADAVIRGLLESLSYGKHEIAPHSLNDIVSQSLRAVEAEVIERKIRVSQELAPTLPDLQLDPKKVKHALIKLFLGAIEVLPPGGHLAVKTFVRPAPSPSPVGAAADSLLPSAELVGVELDHDRPPPAQETPGPPPAGGSDTEVLPVSAFELMVIRKVIELFGGMLQTDDQDPARARIAIVFKQAQASSPPNL